MELTMEQFSQAMRDVLKAERALAVVTTTPPTSAAVTLNQPELSDRVVKEINGLFAQENFRTALAKQIASVEVHQDLPADDKPAPKAGAEAEAEMGRGNPVAAAIESMDNLGGWGIPFDRDPALVRQDVIEGYVSIESAARDYGVVIDPQTFEITCLQRSNLSQR